MARESIGEKATRYLATGQLRVTRANADVVAATCRGRGGQLYHLGYRHGRWSCSCPARKTCAHLRALQLVTSLPTGRGLAEARGHARFHAARTGERERIEVAPTPMSGWAEVATSPFRRPAGEPEWVTMPDGRYAVEVCAECGIAGRVAAVDGLCPECTTAPPAR